MSGNIMGVLGFGINRNEDSKSKCYALNIEHKIHIDYHEISGSYKNSDFLQS